MPGPFCPFDRGVVAVTGDVFGGRPVVFVERVFSNRSRLRGPYRRFHIGVDFAPVQGPVVDPHLVDPTAEGSFGSVATDPQAACAAAGRRRRRLGGREFAVDVEAYVGAVPGGGEVDPFVLTDLGSSGRRFGFWSFADEGFGVPFFGRPDAEAEYVFAARFPDHHRV